MGSDVRSDVFRPRVVLECVQKKKEPEEECKKKEPESTVSQRRSAKKKKSCAGVCFVPVLQNAEVLFKKQVHAKLAAYRSKKSSTKTLCYCFALDRSLGVVHLIVCSGSGGEFFLRAGPAQDP